MPALSFQSRFAPLVESGKKRQTIRLERKRPWRVGDRLYLYTGMRTAGCRKLGEAVVRRVVEVTIDREWFMWSTGDSEGISAPATSGLAQDFAKADGFANYEEMAGWFEQTHGLPFDGVLIRWGAVEG